MLETEIIALVAADAASPFGWRVNTEDEALVGGNAGIYEGADVRKRAVIAAGTVIVKHRDSRTDTRTGLEAWIR